MSNVQNNTEKKNWISQKKNHSVKANPVTTEEHKKFLGKKTAGVTVCVFRTLPKIPKDSVEKI